ncbi:MAG: relaxase/mobilization nuclease domain-containing protein [Ruminiclostridium sp.]|nr:relaxase/mobilization nuclease domain-containing protein [Ruminiclostridium sp.]
MPYIKVISIKNSVAGCLNYIANPDKTEERTLLTGINTSDDLNEALQDFKLTYEVCSHKSFTAKPLEGKSPVKAFHLVQSFAASECSVETAHRIGVEWVQKAFGADYQVVVTTHVDTEHIHNHFLLCPYDLNGKKFNSNKASLDRVRKISDAICRSYGIGEMEKLRAQPDHKPYAICYGEWLHRKRGTSWKAHIAEYIDHLIPFAKNLDELLKIMEAHGYTIKRGFYISVKAPEQGRAVRLKTLGVDYTENMLRQRIQDYLDSQPKQRTIPEIYQLILREFERETRNICFAAGVKNTTELLGKQLALINSEHITGIGQAEGLLEKTQKRITELETAITDLSAEIQHKQIVAAAAERFFGKTKPYPATQKKADKLVLKNAGVSSLADVSEYSADVESDNTKLAEMQAELVELKKREALLHNIVTTYNDRDDYITKLVKRTREKLSEQEQARVAELKAKMYTVYTPIETNNFHVARANIDYYKESFEQSVFDVSANPDNIGEVLTTIRDTADLYAGDVICLDNVGYYLDYDNIYRVDDFMQSRAEAERQRQEQIERERQEKLARQKRLAEEQRRLEEQKKKKEEETAKSVKPKRNRGLH